ncbi:MAG: S41 family peptidase [Anaerolineales bacterium]|nr:S41 family peptidase [Anaerolineales bacterium]
MNSKPLIVISTIVVVVILLTGTCSAGFLAGRAFDTWGQPTEITINPDPSQDGIPSTQTSPDQGGTPQDLQELFEPFWQTWDAVNEFYVTQPVDQELLMQGAIRGMLDALKDDHTSYLDPEMFKRANEQLEGTEYEGIGAWVDTTQDYLTIISPMPGSPAEKAGLKPNDRIIAIDGEDMTGVAGEVARQKVLGPKGTTVILTISREGMEPFDATVERAEILTPTVESKMLEGNVGYVRLYTFGKDTARDLKDHLENLLDQKPVGLILDLRYNGGGYLTTAIDVVSQFIGDGIVMYEEYGDGNSVVYEAKKGGVATEIPLVVLVNEGSASASEIVAGAIQDRGRGKLVGIKSFGKGSVQNYIPLENDQGAVRITIAYWLTPNGRQINGEGLEPDVLVELSEEDLAAGRDPQLDKAIELLVE